MNIKCSKCGESVELPMIHWDRGINGQVNNATFFRLERYFHLGRWVYVLHSVLGQPSNHESADEAKAEAQRLFDEWMGGLMESNP